MINTQLYANTTAFIEINIGLAHQQIGVGFDGRAPIGLHHQMPTPTPDKPIGAGAAILARQKVNSLAVCWTLPTPAAPFHLGSFLLDSTEVQFTSFSSAVKPKLVTTRAKQPGLCL
jgi:hypothetical protein